MICVKNGLIFDKEIIQSYLKGGQTVCPITKMSLSFEEDFRHVRGLEGPALSYKSSASRLDTLKSLIENYRDMVMEAKGNKETIEVLKRKLGNSLKQQKASLRLIGTLKQQRDEARDILVRKGEFDGGEEEKTMQVEDDGEGLKEEIKTNSIRLNKVRKELAKSMNEIVFESQKMADLSAKSFKIKVKKFKKERPLVLAHPFNSDIWMVCPKGKSGSPILADYEAGSHHTIKVPQFQEAKFLQTSNLISDDDSLGYFMTSNTGTLFAGSINTETGEHSLGIELPLDFGCHGLEEHPINRLFLHLDDQRTLRLFDVNEERMVMGDIIDNDLELNCMAVHPDGKLVSLGGTNGQVHFYDLTAGQVVISLDSSQVSFI
jgi:hypothetical protein